MQRGRSGAAGLARAGEARLLLAATLLAAACRPATVEEAEAKADVARLEQIGTPEAIAAIGRLADHEPRAEKALESRTFDPRAYQAAWSGVLRGSPWATEMLRRGLASPADADSAASAMGHRDAHLGLFVPDLENALVRLGASQRGGTVAGALASVGPAAHDAVARRLHDPATRHTMCAGMVAADADPDAQKALLAAPAADRDDDACVEAVVRAAANDDTVLGWLSANAETGLLGAASKDRRVGCQRLATAWKDALATRDKGSYAALAVPLGYAITRCPRELDEWLGATVRYKPDARLVVVRAVDPFAFYEGGLAATCTALRAMGPLRDPIASDRLADALSHTCKL